MTNDCMSDYHHYDVYIITMSVPVYYCILLLISYMSVTLSARCRCLSSTIIICYYVNENEEWLLMIFSLSAELDIAI